MASQWLLDEIKNSSRSSVPVAAPKAPAPMPVQKAPVQKVSAPTSTAPSAAPKGKFFTGNLLEKAFDVVRVPEYAMAGALNAATRTGEQQMKAGNDMTLSGVAGRFNAAAGGLLSGVQNRQEFGREPGQFNVTRATVGPKIGINPLVETVGNFGYSLAAPQLPIGKIAGVAGKVASKVPGVASTVGKAQGIGTRIVGAARATPQISNTLEKLPGLEFFRNPEAGKIFEGANKATSQRVSELFNQVADVAKGLSKKERVLVGNLIEGRLPTKQTFKLSLRANYVKELSDKIGKELVDLGVMTPKTFAKYKGRYMSHIADTVKGEEKARASGGALKIFSDNLKQRKGVLGSGNAPDYIREFQFPTFKGLSGEISTAESTRALKETATKFGKTAQDLQAGFGETVRKTKEGMVSLEDLVPPKVKHLFKDVAVPPEIADYVSRRYAKSDPKLLSTIADKALDAWKMGKTVLNPAYHVRNLASNQILSDYATGAGIPATLAGYAKAVAAYAGKGSPKYRAYLQELKNLGVVNRVNMSRGIEKLKPSVFGQNQGVLRKVAGLPGKVQNASEETAKLNVYAFFRNKGLSPQEAAKKAEEAIFSPYNINKAERSAVRQVTPFYSFTRQALPFTAKTLAKKPGTLTKYEKAKTAVEGLSPDDAERNANLPEEMRGQVRLPVKDEEGNNAYFDPKYILPHGNFTEGEVGRGILPGGLGLNPLLTEAASQLFNKDLYFNQPIAKSNIPARATGQRTEHAIRAGAPTLYTTLKGKLAPAFKGETDYVGRSRSKVMAILDAFGIKSSIFRPEEESKFNSYDLNNKIRSIEREQSSIMQDQRIPDNEKEILIEELNKVLEEAVNNYQP